jgi:extracellular elastinolytic metalloproteinase
MGEGYSDAMAIMLQMTSNDTRLSAKVLGTYVTGNTKGVRSKPYSTDMNVNPYTYQDLAKDKFNEVHMIGEVWAAMLNEVYWNMVQQSGFVPVIQLRDSQASGYGNSDYLQLFINGLKKNPCNPNFIQARDAILAADQITFNSKYNCAIWAAFAKRGLGYGAKSDFVNNFLTNPACVQN